MTKVKRAEIGSKTVPVLHSRTDAFLGLVQLSRRIYDMSILSVVFQPCGGVNRKSQGLRSYPNPVCDPSPHRPRPGTRIFPKLSNRAKFPRGDPFLTYRKRAAPIDSCPAAPPLASRLGGVNYIAVSILKFNPSRVMPRFSPGSRCRSVSVCLRRYSQIRPTSKLRQE